MSTEQERIEAARAWLQEHFGDLDIEVPPPDDAGNLAALLAEWEAKGAALEGAEDEALRDRMADLLTRTAAALKGPPKPLHLHDWADLPDVAVAVCAVGDALAVRAAAAETERDEARETIARLNRRCQEAESAGIVPEDGE